MIIRKGQPALKRFFVFIGIFIIIFGSFFYGYVLGQKSIAQPIEPKSGKILNKEVSSVYLLKDVNFQLFWDVWKIAQDKYFQQPVKDTQLFYGALEGMVASLEDPHSVFLNPDLMAKFQDDLKGSFEGIGAELAIKNKRLTIVTPLPYSPAERAGIKPKDWIQKIEEEDTTDMPLDQAVSKIRGKKGTEIKLSIFREGFTLAKVFPIKRDVIKVESVQYEEKGDFAYLRIINFDENCEKYFQEALEKILQKQPKGIILDLRNNPGGLLDAAVNIAGNWLKKGELVVIEQWPKKNDEYRAEKDGALQNIPTIVLINEGSASGSEILAGALRDQIGAKLVGKKTFGKGSVQELEKLPDGSAVKVTVAKWLTPLGQQINDIGIAPDYEIELTEEDFSADFDPQLDKAIEILNNS